jgi:hypothetical protein
MPIELTCTCGRELHLRDELAGLQIRCPECATTLHVPSGAEDTAANIALQPPLEEEIVETVAVHSPASDEIVETVPVSESPPRLPAAPPPPLPGEEPVVTVAPPILRPQRLKAPEKKRKKRVFEEFYGESTEEGDPLIGRDTGWFTIDRLAIIGAVLSILSGILWIVLLICLQSHFRSAWWMAIGLIFFGAMILLKTLWPITNE